MKIKGIYTIDASPATAWKLLTDPEVLAGITPGISRLERIEGNKFKAVSKINIGPVRGAFEGELELKDMLENESMLVILDQKSKIGTAVAEVTMKLQAADNGKTEILYEGESKLTGTIARMGQRIMGGVISTLTKQFFKGLEKEIDSI